MTAGARPRPNVAPTAPAEKAHGILDKTSHTGFRTGLNKYIGATNRRTGSHDQRESILQERIPEDDIPPLPTRGLSPRAGQDHPARRVACGRGGLYTMGYLARFSRRG